MFAWSEEQRLSQACPLFPVLKRDLISVQLNFWVKFTFWSLDKDADEYVSEPANDWLLFSLHWNMERKTKKYRLSLEPTY